MLQTRVRFIGLDDAITRSLGYYPIKSRELYDRVLNNFGVLGLRTFYRVVQRYAAAGVIERVVLEAGPPAGNPTYGYRMPRLRTAMSAPSSRVAPDADSSRAAHLDVLSLRA